MKQQYIYIVQWGKTHSIVNFLSTEKQLQKQYVIVPNETIINSDYYGVVIN